MTYKVKYIQRNGYLLIYRPKHHRASTDGYVYQHILVAEKGLGRKLRSDEVVHHLNFNRADNTSANLLVLTEEQHIRLHVWLRSGAPIADVKYGLHKGVKPYIVDNEPYSRALFCKMCGDLIVTNWGKHYCSHECANSSRRKVDISKKELKLLLSQGLPWTDIGRILSVSDNGARSIARRLGILTKRL